MVGWCQPLQVMGLSFTRRGRRLPMFFPGSGTAWYVISLIYFFRCCLQRRMYGEDESCLETDPDSYIRTDEEEAGNTEWEDSARRWVSR